MIVGQVFLAYFCLWLV